MKIRNGFVSNSSTGSFLVSLVDWNNKKKELITPEQKQILLDYGFQFTSACIPEHLEWGDSELGNEEGRCLGYTVFCNQDDVIDFLVKNKIPFTALSHYGDESVYYFPEKDQLITLPNYGRQFDPLSDYAEIYEKATGKEMSYKKCMKTCTREEWLKNSWGSLEGEDNES